MPLDGPKFVPVNVIAAPPDVTIAPPPATADIAGAVYDSVATDAELTCPPTLIFHKRLAPTPVALMHVTVVLSTETMHDVAAYSTPVVPYVAVTV